MPISWICPYCNRPCTIGEDDIRIISSSSWIAKDYGYYKADTKIIVCPNPECRKQTISLKIVVKERVEQRYHKTLYRWNLLPESAAKPFPDYIPKQIINDYKEACLIKEKSPKASATLSRRCLQGIIRDFWKIKKNRLVDEIDELQNKIDPTVWKAIDAVRRVGNIAAHMEKDVNLIIDVDTKEVELLIWLIETLFKEKKNQQKNPTGSQTRR